MFIREDINIIKEDALHRNIIIRTSVKGYQIYQKALK